MSPLPIVFHPDYVTPLPDGHRFPMSKFGGVYHCLVQDGIAALDQFQIPDRATVDMIKLVHTAEYADAYLSGVLDAKALRRIGLPWSSSLVTRTCTAIGGTILTATLALQRGLACNTAGGTHHAHADFGSGFCIFNDLAIAARSVQERGLAKKILIVDLDVHQGDGSAAIFVGDESVFTFSMHCGKNFPFRKKKSDLDVDLPVDAGDDLYLAQLQHHLPQLLTQVQPDLVLYDGGVDPHVDDRLGKLALTDDGIYQRDLDVLQMCVSQGVPVASVVGGGYGSDLPRLARRHCLLFRAATDVYQKYGL